MSTKPDISPSMLKLRKLREKLCNSEDNWKKAFEIKDFIICELSELSQMLDDSNVPREECLEKSKKILNKFLIHQDRV